MTFSGILRAGKRERRVAVTLRDGRIEGTIDGKEVSAAVERRGGALLLTSGAETLRAVVARDGDRILVHLGGRVHEFEIADGTNRRRASPGRRHLPGDDPWAASPMTGTVVEVAVKPGDAVPAGGKLAVVEAMKMQFVVRATRDVVVRAVRAAAGQAVDIGAVLVEFVENPGDGPART